MLKRFKDVIPNFIQVLIILLLSIYYLILNWPGLTPVLYSLRAFLPVVFIFLALMYLLVKGKLFASHVILFIVHYLSRGRSALMTLLSYDFHTMAFLEDINLWVFIYLIIFIYFIMMIFSYILSNKVNGRVDRGHWLILVLLTFILFYIYFGLNQAFILLLPAILGTLFGVPIASGLLLLSSMIAVPLTFVIHIIEGTLLDQTIAYFIFVILSVILIYFSSKRLMKSL
ncbi:hypothetical protein KHQ88_04395 [Mycoplasmatota bacterium]|nr:hypothetical protein KHQ88_04395 [Mycoplasmatota bacterium]